MTTYTWVSVATDQPDRDGERFSKEALKIIASQAIGMPVRVNFEGEPVGSVVGSALMSTDRNWVDVLARGDLAEGTYIVPQFAFDRATITEEDGVKVYHEIKLMGFGLTTDPSDSHLTPLRTGDD